MFLLLCEFSFDKKSRIVSIFLLCYEFVFLEIIKMILKRPNYLAGSSLQFPEVEAR